MPRVKPHFKLHVSIRNHGKTLGVASDDALLAMYCRAGMLAVERFADRTGDSFLLDARDLEWLAGTRPVANAELKLGRLVAGSPLELGREGAGWRLTIPNFAKKQGFGSRKGAETGDTPSPPPSPTPTEEQNPSDSAADAASSEPEVSAEEADRERRVRLAARLCPKGHDAIAFEVFVRQHLEQIEAYHRGKPQQRFPQALMAFYNRKRASMASEGSVPVGGRP